MINKILAWLFTFFYTPVPNKVIQPPEVETMSDVPVEVAPETPVEEVKAGVADFEAALEFVESGVAQLGEAAKDELKELAKKYL